jgi:predicted dithiol-disulfide oxidoreductase (DUF899 family)
VVLRPLGRELLVLDGSIRSNPPTEGSSEMFDGLSQLIVYHFMFPPEWDEGCAHCSFWSDNFDGAPVHLRARDTSFGAVCRAPLATGERLVLALR